MSSTAFEVIDRSPQPEATAFAPDPEPEISFPLEGLPAPLRQSVQDCMRVFGVRADLPTICGLGAAAAAIGKGLHIMEGRKTRGNLFCLARAPSGAGKSSTFAPFIKPLLTIEKEILERFETDLPNIEAERDLLEADEVSTKRDKNKTAEEKQQRLATIKARLRELESQLHPRRLMSENVTSEQLGILMARNNETFAIISADCAEVVSNWMGEHRKSGRTDEGLYLKGWSGDPCMVDRVGRGAVSLKDPCLTVLLCMTPDELRNLFSSERFVAGGLMPRMLVCESWSRPLPRISGMEAPQLDAGKWNAWEGVIKQLYQQFNTGEQAAAVRLAPEARERFNEAHNAYCASFDTRPDGDSFEARHVEKAMHIALVLHAIEHTANAARHLLSGNTAQTALALATFYGQAARRHQEAARQERDSDTLQRIISTAENYGTGMAEGMFVSLRDLKNRNGFTPEQIESLAINYPQYLKTMTKRAGASGGQHSKGVLIRTHPG